MGQLRERSDEALLRAWLDIEAALGEILSTLAGSVPFEDGVWSAYWKMAAAVTAIEQDRQNR